tara:strand:+ start:587 stop:724 length:138 start_codon:yes stop_codon:yes gene_type:complete
MNIKKMNIKKITTILLVISLFQIIFDQDNFQGVKEGFEWDSNNLK